MANWYVYSGAAGAGTGADWANAYTTLSAALAAKAAGDTFYVADDHNESTAGAVTFTSPGTLASPCKILCVRRSGGSVPPVSADIRTTAVCAMTGANNMGFAGRAYCYGVTFRAGDGSNAAQLNVASGSGANWTFDSCLLELGTTSTSSRIVLGSGGSNNYLKLINTPMKFGSTSQGARVQSGFIWESTPSAIQGSLPTTLFLTPASTYGGDTELRCVDLSALGSGKTLLALSSALMGEFIFTRCKLGASVTKTSGSLSSPNSLLPKFIDCDSGDVNTQYLLSRYFGTIESETTIKRTSGANDGTTGFCHKMISGADAEFFWPLESEWITFWNETVGSSVTVTVPVLTDNVTLKDNEAWVEVEYLGTSGYPFGTIITDRAADVLNAGTNQTTDSVSTWTTTGLSTPVKQELSVSFTPQEKGLIRARVCLAKPSATIYYDPKILSTSGRQYQDCGVVNEGAGGGVIVIED